jgi:hypothetical protein
MVIFKPNLDIFPSSDEVVWLSYCGTWFLECFGKILSLIQ